MGAVSDFFTTGTFWWGTGVGTVLGAALSSGVSYLSKHKSDTRNFDHDDEKDDRQAKREQDERNAAIVFEAASDYAKTVSDLLITSVDEEGIFNYIRDEFLTGTGQIDPNVVKKIAFAKIQLVEVKKVSTSMANLKLFASQDLMDAAVRVFYSVQALTQSMTNAQAKQASFNAASIELDKFMNQFRVERGLPKYEAANAQAAMPGFKATLKAQAEAFQSEAAEMRRGAPKKPRR